MEFVNAYISLLREAFNDIVEAGESHTARGFLIAAAILTPVFGSLFFFAILVNAEEYTAPAPTVTVEAVQVDNSTINIDLRNNSVLLNAVEVELYFDPAHIYVGKLSITDSLCEERFVITKEIDNKTGRVFYQCGTVTPFAGTSTTLATLTITPLKYGTSTVNFGLNTNTLAHDGYGSNVTKERIGAQYSFAG